MDDKLFRDEFMHSNGTSAVETLGVIVPSALFTLLSCLLSSLAFAQHRMAYPTLKRFTLEFAVIILPLILGITVWVNHTYKLLASLYVVIVSLGYFCFKQNHNSEGREVDLKQQGYDVGNKGFITNARATINLISVIAILAVDFAIFPRRFAKTEAYGYSLMDTGVGLFVYSNAIVAPEIRNKNLCFLKTLKGLIPLLILGSARCVLTKEIDYHVPVSEYGTHWNFFFTLAATKIISSLILTCIPIKYAFHSGALLLFVHEVLLQLILARFVISNVKRDSFVTANREGIVSSLGYAGLYFLCVAFGHFVKTKSQVGRDKRALFGEMCKISAVLLWATFVLEKNFGVSRRLANAGYCMWVLFIAVLMTSLFQLFEIALSVIYRGGKAASYIEVPVIFDAINYNGLAFFLIANMLTGCVKMAFDTLRISTFYSLVILVCYMFLNCVIVLYLYHKKLKLRL